MGLDLFGWVLVGAHCLIDWWLYPYPSPFLLIRPHTGVGQAGQAAAERRHPQVLRSLPFPRPADARDGLGLPACVCAVAVAVGCVLHLHLCGRSRDAT